MVEANIMQAMDAHATDWCDRLWTQWIPLDSTGDLFKSRLPSGSGLYRVRACQGDGLVYVGQTGRNLLERTKALARGVYRTRDNPPWNDPHTAAPLMWAYRIEDGLQFEISGTEVHLDKPNRQCLEDLLLHKHRIHYGKSTLANHGRLHPLWTRPSNGSKGRAATRRDAPELYPSLPVATGVESPTAHDWIGLKWSAFEPISSSTAKNEAGVYRIKDHDDLLYLGQSKKLQARINTHAKDPRFTNCQISYHAMLHALDHHLLEREVDLIGSYYALESEPPRFQYQPQRRTSR